MIDISGKAATREVRKNRRKAGEIMTFVRNYVPYLSKPTDTSEKVMTKNNDELTDDNRTYYSVMEYCSEYL